MPQNNLNKNKLNVTWYVLKISVDNNKILILINKAGPKALRIKVNSTFTDL